MSRFLRILYTILIFIPLFKITSQAQWNLVQVNFPGKTETSPRLNHQGNEIIFISDLDGQEKIYISPQLPNGNFGPAKPWNEINLLLKDFSHLEGPALTYEGSQFYFSGYQPGISQGMDIYYCDFRQGKWDGPYRLDTAINSPLDEESPSLSADNQHLYFTRPEISTDKDKQNCKRIFYSFLTSENSWSVPQSLQGRINLGCECTPWIAPDNITLFFSSRRDGGKGGWDIYFTRRFSSNLWLNPEPMDTLNSGYDDIYPTVNLTGSLFAYKRALLKNDPDFGNIFAGPLLPKFSPFPLLRLEGSLTDLYNQKPLMGNISLQNQSASTLLPALHSKPETGKWGTYVPLRNLYLLDVSRPGYSHDITTVNGQEKNAFDTVQISSQIFPSISLILNVFDEELLEPLDAKVKIWNQDSVPLPVSPQTIGTGRYNLSLDIGIHYLLSVSCENFYTQTFPLNLETIVQFSQFERDIALEPMKTDVEIRVADEETNEDVEVEIVITNLEKNEVIVQKAKKDKEGKYVVKLRKGDKYEVNINSPKGYSFYSTKVNMEEGSIPEKLDVKLTPLKPTTKLTLNDINFGPNSAELQVSSYAELDRVVKLMNDNPEIRIEISAHTDDIGTENYNLNLSGKRAESVVMYLTEQRISSERLVFKGYGESSPLLPNISEENRAKNRRVELKIIDMENPPLP